MGLVCFGMVWGVLGVISSMSQHSKALFILGLGAFC